MKKSLGNFRFVFDRECTRSLGLWVGSDEFHVTIRTAIYLPASQKGCQKYYSDTEGRQMGDACHGQVDSVSQALEQPLAATALGRPARQLGLIRTCFDRCQFLSPGSRPLHQPEVGELYVVISVAIPRITFR